MAKITGLWKDPRSGILYLRRKVPEALRPLFGCGEIYKVTLGTSDRREGEKRLAIANGEFEKKVALFRETLKSQGGGALSPDEAKALVERHLTRRSGTGFASGGVDVAFLLRELDLAVADISGERTPTAQSMSPEDWTAYRMRIINADDDDDEASEEAVARIAADLALRNKAPGERWFEFQQRMPRRRWRPLLNEAVATLKRQLGLASGIVPGIDEPIADAIADALAASKVRDQAPRIETSRRRPNATRAQPDMKLRELAAVWKASRKPSPKMVAAVDKAVADFTSYIGDIGIGEITAEDCFEFRDAVSAMPNRMPKAHRNLAFIDQYTLYSQREDLDQVMPASIKKYLGAIQLLLGFGFQERYIPSNVAAGIKVDGYSKKGDRRPFTKDELTKLFAGDLFTQPWSLVHSKSAVSDTTMRWLFLLGLMTGGRIEELGQVLLTDVKTELGAPYIDVTDYVAPDAEGETSRVKTEGSHRVLPLHPHLIDLGFSTYVRRLRAANATRLFPDLKADKLGVKTKEASRRAARLIDRVIGKDPRIVFYSFRHTFKDLCRDADIPKDVHDQLTGHAPADVGSGYGFGRAVSNLYRHIERLELGFINWQAIIFASLD